jgi:hypothetical protein
MDNNAAAIPPNVIALENELQQLVEELLRPRQQTNQRFPSPQGAIPTSEYMVFLQSLRDIMVMYNSNISEYNNNVTMSLNIMQELFHHMHRVNDPGPVPVPGPIHGPGPAQSPERNNDHLFSYVLYRPTIRGQDASNMRRFFQNILVRPTPEQIESSTQLVPYRSNVENANTSCPITLDEFQEDEMVRQIKHCRHTFQEHALQNWFQRNVRCPVCRYDIRDYNMGSESGPRPDTTTVPSPEDPPPIPPENGGGDYQSILQQITQNFAADINNILNENFQPNSQTDGSGNLIFEFQVETNL